MSLRHFQTVMLGDVCAKALTAAFVLGLVRFLAPPQFASYVYQSALMILAATLLSGFFNRHFILGGEEASARAYQAFQTASACIAFVILALVVAGDLTVTELLAGFACTVAAARFDFGRTHAQKSMQFPRYAAADVTRALLVVVLSVPVVLWGAQHTVAWLLATQGLAFLVGTRLLPRLPAWTTPRSQALAATSRLMVANRSSLALLGYFGLVGLFGQLPLLMLKQFASTAELAAFGSAFRYYGLLLGIVAVVNVVILPRFAKTNDLKQSLKDTVNILLLAATLVGLASAGGYLLIPWIDESKYPDAPLIFGLLCLGLIPGLILAPMTAAFLRMDRHVQLLQSQVVAVLTCAITVWLLRSNGAFAAAWSLPAGVLAQFVWLALIALHGVRK